MITWTPSAPSVIIQNTGNASPQGLDIPVFNNQAFGKRVILNASVGNNNNHGISNAAGSGKDVYIDGLIIWCSVATNVRIGFAIVAFGAGQVWNSLKAGGANAVASYQTSQVVGTPHTIIVDEIFVAANLSTVWVPPRGPLLVPANNSFAAGCVVANLQSTCSIYGREY
jgi:hypothetical protein